MSENECLVLSRFIAVNTLVFILDETLLCFKKTGIRVVFMYVYNKYTIKFCNIYLR